VNCFLYNIGVRFFPVLFMCAMNLFYYHNGIIYN